MRALRHHAFGSPADVLRLDDVPAPEPGPGQVRVRLTHRSINPADLLSVGGHYASLPDLPAVGGHEGVGRIDAVGPDVNGWAAGQRVVPLGAATWQERVVLGADALFAVPDAVADEAAAQLFVNPLTAWLMLDALDLTEGDWLLQTAATSQVGRIVVQLARRRGVRTVNLVRRADARDELEALGADAVVVASADDDPKAIRKQVLERTDGAGAAGALDAVGGRVGGLAARCLGEGATMLIYGRLSGEPIPLDGAALLFQQAAVRGFWRTRWFETHPLADTKAALEPLAALLASGDLELPVAATYDLADWREAVAHSRESGRRGKVLLTG
ncbi:MAG: zinc-dependent alcohol dehydrogenase family protein [Rhodothermales bacterium]|nr:zinc-dependent alcohol dehydrogenase family protein [Rhodothermales bacterium]